MSTVRPATLVGLVLVLSLAACSAGAAAPGGSSGPPTPGGSLAPTEPPPTQVPGGLVGSEPPDTGVVGGGGNGGQAPGGGAPQVVVPHPGTQNPQPVSVESLEAHVEGTRVSVVATWWSGVEPCYLLDTVSVKQDGNHFTIALAEGSAGGDVACIEIAVQKSTIIDLGELAPGEYTVTAQDGTAAPITFTVG